MYKLKLSKDKVKYWIDTYIDVYVYTLLPYFYGLLTIYLILTNNYMMSLLPIICMIITTWSTIKNV